MFPAEAQKRIFDQAKSILNSSPDASEILVTHLKEIIRFADWKYYVESDPVFADEEYDRLFALLRSMEAAHPEWLMDDSPTQRVALGLSERLPTVAHLVPMLSLDNTYNADDLRDWARRCETAIAGESITYCVEPKYDGASISLIYEADRLSRAATRGDGVSGEEITNNVKQIKSIPLSAAFATGGVRQLEIRGEVVIHKETFAGLNRQRASEGLAPLANPRNAASGTLRMLDPAEVAKRKLSAVLYHISDYSLLGGAGTPASLHTHYDSLKWLQELGFPTPVKEMRLFTDIDGVIGFCADFETKRDELPYEIDGLVIKVNDFAQQERMGMTAHHPRWAVAYKFKARQATSKLRAVEFQVGRTGSVTPVAKIDPVNIGGATVSSISLFNEDVVREKDIHIGDTVLVERAGDVIPYIVKALPDLRDGTEQEILFPTHCPVCGEMLERPEDEAVWRCINFACKAQAVERILHYCSKDAMDIRGMGESNVARFFELELIRSVPDLYRIDWTQVAALEGFKDKSVSNLRAAVDASREQPLNRLIFGLGIRHVGETTAKNLARKVTDLRDFYSWTEEQFIRIEDIGPKVAASLAHFFASHDNRESIQALADAGVNMINTQSAVLQQEGAFSGKTFLFTGTLSQMKRSDAEAKAEALGAQILGGVSSKLNYLVVGADAGSKLEKAKKLGTVIILTEEEFIRMLETSANS
ncbi:NAD-dependent DNA ligase LigA [Rurimicrobium arvi]|uniref:DNA ligase n=1 Tax=Rurimicrobium arvi TaxID=2049916 RepID=A0ABP8MCD9_9BACT